MLQGSRTNFAPEKTFVNRTPDLRMGKPKTLSPHYILLVDYDFEAVIKPKLLLGALIQNRYRRLTFSCLVPKPIHLEKSLMYISVIV